MMAVRDDGLPPQEGHRVAGLGWEARIYEDEIELIVSPHEDMLPLALASLFSQHQLRYWSYVWDHHDSLGRDVYLLNRGMLV